MSWERARHDVHATLDSGNEDRRRFWHVLHAYDAVLVTQSPQVSDLKVATRKIWRSSRTPVEENISLIGIDPKPYCSITR